MKELSRKLGVSLSTIRRISQSKHCNVGIDVIIKFGKAFDVTASLFVDETLLPMEDGD